MSSARGKDLLGVGGRRNHLSRKALSGAGGKGAGAGRGGPQDVMAARRELVRRLREGRG
ncbi:hypothetical protein GCM10023347_39820 [Streptomyces chumphonensis]|uniref:Uncharacterized protein n=1 Tax=Streptomyces chumphonensis TaxID=1214925 RepID=A0A927EXJ2_9ACTN|nr:DUF6243 family protein [Streptomyces chumphonensis]MBD3930499.1 hypothetical protein [Streptomyces chumphonensis]